MERIIQRDFPGGDFLPGEIAIASHLKVMALAAHLSWVMPADLMERGILKEEDISKRLDQIRLTALSRLKISVLLQLEKEVSKRHKTEFRGQKLPESRLAHLIKLALKSCGKYLN